MTLIEFPERLNSREIHPSVAVFEGGNYGLNLIERANRRAVAETWNVPAVRGRKCYVLHSHHSCHMFSHFFADCRSRARRNQRQSRYGDRGGARMEEHELRLGRDIWK